MKLHREEITVARDDDGGLQGVVLADTDDFGRRIYTAYVIVGMSLDHVSDGDSEQGQIEGLTEALADGRAKLTAGLDPDDYTVAE
jgi:hypothetical protein